VRRTPDEDVLRARQRVLLETYPEGHFIERPRPRGLPVMSARQVKDHYQGKAVIILDGYAVDVAGFARSHPGGEGLLRAGYGGRDLSEGFRKLNHHTRHARALVEDMRIAQVVND
jgi:cytochrome b involved in lipid metabolism